MTAAAGDKKVTDTFGEGPVAEALARTELAPVAITHASARESRRAAVENLEDTASLNGTAAFAKTALVGERESVAPEEAVSVSTDLPNLSGADRYEMGARIGSGGMGEVVLQVDRNIGRAVAKKMLHPEIHGQVALQRFIREARVQGQLEHPSVVPVHDFGVDADGRLFFSMKRIRGQTLGQIIERLAASDRETQARFSRHKLLSAFVQVCLAIEYAHKRGVIHRDLKPSNVMLGDFGEVYVLDWGLAKLTSRGDDAELVVDRVPAPRTSSPDMTSDGDFLGTPLYMAPEQLLGRHAGTDERADVFGLGAILFEILTLEPFRRGTTLASLIADAETSAPVDRPSERAGTNPLDEEVPAALDELCVSALARDPAQRLGSARAFGDAVTRYLEGDRDLVARRAQAAELVASARARIATPTKDEAGEGEDRVTAVRDVLKALALAPGDADAQQLLVTLMLEGSSDLSPEAARAFDERDVDVRVQGFRRGAMGLAMWLATLPLALMVGVRDWRVLSSLVVLTVLCICFILAVLRSRTAIRSRVPAIVLASVCSLIIALTTTFLGPFVLVPVAACAACTMFLIHSAREEAPVLGGIWILGIFAAFSVEWLHLLPPAYSFTNGDIVLHPRLLNLPETTTMAFLTYTSVSFVAGIGWAVSLIRGKQRDAERRLFGQAWLLQRLFPSNTAEKEKEKAAPSTRRSRRPGEP